jgi:pilus assembly protein Flp/PilA
MLKFCILVDNLVRRGLGRDDRGVTSVEYGLLVTLIAIAIIATVTTLGGNLSNMFGSVGSQIHNAPAPGGGGGG